MRKIVPLLLALLLLLTAACSGPGSGSSSEDDQTYTGILEENKGFMITVSPSEENSDTPSYVFGTEGVTVDAEVGDKVVVTYTGDIDEVGSLLEATKVEKAA